MYKTVINTGLKNRRITVETWATVKDTGGGTSGTIVSSYKMWADVESRDGRMIQGENQRMWPYNFKLTVRFEKSRPIYVNQTIVYDGNRMSIQSISINREGMRWEYILRCSSVGQTGLSVVGPGEISTNSTKNFSFTAIDNTNVWADPSLINKQIVGAFKDGFEWQVILTGTPVGKQVLYTASTGTFLWGVNYSQGEYSLIQYI
jgi:SPP1 family predicted phage head-tail adaptor